MKNSSKANFKKPLWSIIIFFWTYLSNQARFNETKLVLQTSLYSAIFVRNEGDITEKCFSVEL